MKKVMTKVEKEVMKVEIKIVILSSVSCTQNEIIKHRRILTKVVTKSGKNSDESGNQNYDIFLCGLCAESRAFGILFMTSEKCGEERRTRERTHDITSIIKTQRHFQSY